MVIFVQRSNATEKEADKALDAHIKAQVEKVGLGHMGTTVEGAIHTDLGEKVGTYKGHVSSDGRLVSTSVFTANRGK